MSAVSQVQGRSVMPEDSPHATENVRLVVSRVLAVAFGYHLLSYHTDDGSERIRGDQRRIGHSTHLLND